MRMYTSEVIRLCKNLKQEAGEIAAEHQVAAVWLRVPFFLFPPVLAVSADTGQDLAVLCSAGRLGTSPHRASVSCSHSSACGSKLTGCSTSWPDTAITSPPSAALPLPVSPQCLQGVWQCAAIEQRQHTSQNPLMACWVQ